MEAYVDEDTYISCGVCEGVCADIFSLDTGVAVAKDGDVDGSLEDSVIEENK